MQPILLISLTRVKRLLLKRAVGFAAVACWANLAAAPPLPVPSGIWISPGSGVALPPSVVNQTMNIQQVTPKVTLNWETFNIDPGHTVNFNQPSSSATALNLIHQGDPATIRGSLNANGEVWLLNQNGIVFGKGSQVNVRGLVASTLNLSTDAASKGIAPPTPYAAPVFESSTDSKGKTILDAQGKPLSQPIRVEQGAQLTTNGPNGRIYLFAPSVTNEGSIKAADGQVALAAGSQIYIRQPNASQGSGLIVEVGEGGTVTNGSASNAGTADPTMLLGQVVADRGTATLVGLSVNQLGRVSANSAVRANGTVRLLARNSPSNPSTVLIATQGGTVTLGANSATSANPDTADINPVADASPLLKGDVTVTGKNVVMEAGSHIDAHSGVVKLRANEHGDDQFSVSDELRNSASRIALATGSRIDVSGSNADLDASSNTLTVKLQGAELKDRPTQRDGSLRGKTVTVDLRRQGKLADGTSWVGTPLADLTNDAAAAVKRSNAERTSVGGNVSLEAQGGILLQAGSTIDVSGGTVHHAGGAVQTTQLIRQGKVVDISRADPNLIYDGIFGEYDVTHPKWGISEKWQLFTGGGTGNSVADAYVEGKDAGTIGVVSPRLVLDGTFLGGTTPGLYQRSPTALSLTTNLARPADQLPRRGNLTLGVGDTSTNPAPQDITPDTAIASGVGEQLPVGFNLADDALPSSANKAQVSTDWFGNGKLGFLSLFSAGAVTLPSTAVLDLGLGGGLDIHAREIALDGAVRAPGGNVNLLAHLTSNPPDATPSTGNISIATGASIDVSGLWVNDAARPDPKAATGTAPLLINAGSITASAQVPQEDAGTLSIASGSLLRADGGGALSATGKLTAGKAGSITLEVKSAPLSGQRFKVPLVFDGTLSAYGIDSGGSLSVNAYSWCFSASGCGNSDPTRLARTPDFFKQGGFASYDLTATGGGVVVTAGTTVELQQQNTLLDDDFRTRKTGSELRDFSRPAKLDDARRKPVNLSLSVKAQTPSDQYDDATLRAIGFLDLEAGASILADPVAKIKLASDTRLFLNGTIAAPAGTIDVALRSAISGAKLLEFLPSQTLWLGSSAKLLAAGSFQAIPSNLGLKLGTLSNGGAVNLTANSGYIVAEQGSLIDVRGTSAVLDVTPLGSGLTTPVRRELASDSGNIKLSAAEGILFGGDLRANAINGARAGSLVFELDAQQRNDDVNNGSLILPSGPRVIQVQTGNSAAVATQLATDALLVPGQPISATLNGLALISDSQLRDGGVGDLTLHARNFSRAGIGSVGAIRLLPEVTLTASRRVILDSAGIEGSEGNVHVHAPYVALGNSDTSGGGGQVPQNVGRLFAGDGSLLVDGENVDLVGAFQLNGWRDTQFHVSGDIRLRGVQPLVNGNVSTASVGSLDTTGNLSFAARELYPTTLSHYQISIHDNPQGQISFAAMASPVPVLSVAGELKVQAPRISQGGNLKAPLGAISFEAGETLDLLPGSLTSTALYGVTALFGRIELGTDWVYLLDGTTNSTQGRLVFTPQKTRASDPFPSGRVRLQARTVNLLAGANVDESGGGDLLAYEFQPGLNGTDDPLTGNNAAGRYAILPSLKSDLAPYDPQEQEGFTLPIGESIELTADLPGLLAGRYPLLPARFALLPGAFLVTPHNGYADLAAGVSLPLTGQGTIVSGRRVSSTGIDGDARTGGILVNNANEIATLGKFTLANANSFVALKDQPRPSDAGTLQIAAAESLTLGGTLRAPAGAGGRAGRAEFTGNNLEIVAGAASHALTPGTLSIDANGLNALGAGTLVLGGTTGGISKERTLSVTSGHVTIKSGATIQAPEIILAATDSVTIDTGAAVIGFGSAIAAGDTFSVIGDGALLRVSNGEQLSLLRKDETGVRGTLDIKSGAVISATGSTLFDASKETLLGGTLSLRGSLNLGAPRISLGTPSATTEGLVLSSATLNALTVNELVLTSRQGVDLYGALNLSFDHLVIQAPGLGGYENGNQTAALRASQITLSNPDELAAYTAPAGATFGAGHLSLFAAQIDLSTAQNSPDSKARAEFGINGFASTQFAASDAIVGAGSGAFRWVGDVSMITPRLTTDRGTNLSLITDGALSLRGASDAPSANRSDALGGALSLTARRIEVATRIEMPSGQIELHATSGAAGEGVRLLDGALIDVTGRAIDFAGTPAFAPGGGVKLIADHGDVVAVGNALIDVSGSTTGGAAGSLRLSSPRGDVMVSSAHMRARAANGYAGGSLAFDSAHVAAPNEFGNLLADFSAAGFTEAIDARVHEGDLVLAAGSPIVAHALTITADQGNITVARKLDASGPRGGNIRLAAGATLSINALNPSGENIVVPIEPGAVFGNLRLPDDPAVQFVALTLTARTADGGTVAVPFTPGAAFDRALLPEHATVTEIAAVTAAGGSLTIPIASDAVLDNKLLPDHATISTAGGMITIAPGAVLDAHATAAGNVGGDIDLQSASGTDGTVAAGGIRLIGAVTSDSGKVLIPAAILNVAGDAGGGNVHLRLPQASVHTLLNPTPEQHLLTLNGAIFGAKKTVLEGFLAYADDTISAADVATAGNPRFDAAATFVSNAGAYRRALGNAAADSTFHIRPGVEIRSVSPDPTSADSDLTLDAVWDLSRWRFDNEPGMLTLRAAGNLQIVESLSDGFDGIADLARLNGAGKARRVRLTCSNQNICDRPLDTARPNLLNSDSWSYRLVAGADLASADTRDVAAANQLVRGSVDVGTFSIAPGIGSAARPGISPNANPVLRPILSAVRTGSGTIEINAGRDVTLANRASVVYTAGLDTGVGMKLGSASTTARQRSTLQGYSYPEQGGSVWLHAGANVNGVDPALDFSLVGDQFPRQLVSSWLFRQGDAGPNDRATGWTVAPEYFEQGIATLGGGNVNVVADNDVYNLSVSAASIGRQVGGTTAKTSAVEVVGGGDVHVSAGRDILSGVFYVGKGHGVLTAGGSIASGRISDTLSNAPLYTVLALGDAQLSLQAGNTIELGAVLNPTFIPQGPFQRQTSALERRFNSYFVSYSPASAVALLAKNGDINLRDSSGSIMNAFSDLKFTTETDTRSLTLYAASLSMVSLQGSVTHDFDLTLYPSSQGNLSLLAGESIKLNKSLALSDADPAAFPGLVNPSSFFDSQSKNNETLAKLLDPKLPPTLFAVQPNHGNHATSAEPARVVAKNGNIESADHALLFLARPATVSAGGDILNFDAIVKNTQDTDVSILHATGSMLYSSPRAPTDSPKLAPGSLQAIDNSFQIWGPGRLVVEAGHNVELGTAGGIISQGNSKNRALQGEGAAVSVFAGLGPNHLDFNPFISRYFGADSPYLPQLVGFMRKVNGDDTLDALTALAGFKQLTPEHQADVVLDAYFAELRTTGRVAAAQLENKRDFSRGYLTISTLFPATNYGGDINLFFSQLFTIAGGNIDLLAPGGNINVGLATPPTSFGITKVSSQLGIVTESAGDVRVYLKENFNVNESRVFAADGGDIMVWSNFGDIDAGRGARSSISVPANGFQFDEDGRLTVSTPPAIQGSGIRALTTTVGRPFGNVDLFTPRGVVNASEAGIQSSGNITIAAVQVLGATEIHGGKVTGVPVAVGGISGSVASAGSSASAATKAASNAVAGAGNRANGGNTPLAARPSLIIVEFLGFGDG